ncbi:ammonium transporter [Desulfosporosinus orientis DSM 765]|uniref:Ammonium transporter n=1 Tax=Desulfosporosinus orientis (strain ATCC 19365 / DSM 765 / NCIMB 8382 / VKM B-1628 / Singapore I) TaxID=768706 RepID=G7WFX2_DESOD|nr:ammonium transporter [Desulfosporosinus orientis]AET69487.1 ammonium transporter [Desulfosporosinus orientis DSM 765]
MNINHLWLIVSACFVFFMQAGFVCYEVGFIRSKNVISVAIENILTFVITTLVYCFLGFALMFGPTHFGIYGSDYWLLSHLSLSQNPLGFVFVFFELMFAGTAVTIVSGSMSERTRLLPLLIAAVFLAGVIYPLFGHWVWGNLFIDQPTWLRQIGFMDFAGATVVHGTAGWVSLAGIIVVGSRKDRWDATGKLIKLGRSNIPFAALGTFILWFSWFGFNGGSLLEFNDRVGLILLNTNFAAASGVVGAILTNRFFIKDHSYMEAIFMGALGGLVAITAGSNYLQPLDAVMVGFISGSIVAFSGLWLEKLGLDDAVGAVSIHGFGGAAGTILLAFFAPLEFLGGQTRLVKVLVQFAGVAVNFLWAFGLGMLMFYLINKSLGLRVSEDEEEKGLNIVEFSDIYSWQDYLKMTHYESLTQDLSGKIQVQNQLLQKQAKLLVETQEQERVKLARDLHDGVGQSLAALKLQLGMIAQKVKSEHGDTMLSGQAERTVNLAAETIEEIRGVLFNLKPALLQEKGLSASVEILLQNLKDSRGITFAYNLLAPMPAWEEAESLNLYRIIQECLTNILKHAEATEVMINFSKLTSSLYLFQISDNGQGFNKHEVHAGIGLNSIQERLRMLGGKLEIITEEGKGTTLMMEVPYEY